MGNKGKNLYKCEDCGEKVFMFSFLYSKRSGNRCMCCGGRLEAKSCNAEYKDGERGDRLLMPITGSIIRSNKLNSL